MCEVLVDSDSFVQNGAPDHLLIASYNNEPIFFVERWLKWKRGYSSVLFSTASGRSNSKLSANEDDMVDIVNMEQVATWAQSLSRRNFQEKKYFRIGLRLDRLWRWLYINWTAFSGCFCSNTTCIILSINYQRFYYLPNDSDWFLQSIINILQSSSYVVLLVRNKRKYSGKNLLNCADGHSLANKKMKT